MGDPSQRAHRVARAVDDLRRLGGKAPALWSQIRRRRSLSRHRRSTLPARVSATDSAFARPDARILRRLEAVENALEELVQELRAVAAHEGHAVEIDHRTPALPRAATAPARSEDGPPRIVLDDPFGMLGPTSANGRRDRDLEA
jgi:hypothetical protein